MILIAKSWNLIWWWQMHKGQQTMHEQTIEKLGFYIVPW